LFTVLFFSHTLIVYFFRPFRSSILKCNLRRPMRSRAVYRYGSAERLVLVNTDTLFNRVRALPVRLSPVVFLRRTLTINRRRTFQRRIYRRTRARSRGRVAERRKKKTIYIYIYIYAPSTGRDAEDAGSRLIYTVDDKFFRVPKSTIGDGAVGSLSSFPPAHGAAGLTRRIRRTVPRLFSY
jgi:hypothetical protein